MFDFGEPTPVFPQALKYNPTNEWIFPSIADVSVLPADTRPGRWLMYYSPHETPGGICLAYADALEGPWTEYPENPVISNIWPPHYDDVGHVASPHALWIEEEKKLFLWFHGPNHTTRLATSENGIHFTYDSVAHTSEGQEYKGCFYSRVFRHRMPKLGNSFVMLSMSWLGDSGKGYLAWSNDARSWTVQPEPYLVTPEDIGQNCCSPFLLRTAEGLFVVYHAGFHNSHTDKHGCPTNIYCVPVNEDLEFIGPHRLLYRARPDHPDFDRVSDMIFAKDDHGQLHAFYAAGRRLHQSLYHTSVKK